MPRLAPHRLAGLGFARAFLLSTLLAAAVLALAAPPLALAKPIDAPHKLAPPRPAPARSLTLEWLGAGAVVILAAAAVTVRRRATMRR
jgi:hypothetical protein